MKLVVGLALVLVAACATSGDGDYTTSEPAPLVGVDGSIDQADRNCHVVLRHLERGGASFSFETVGSSWVWSGTIEISDAAAAEGLAPSVMYRMAPSGAWSSVDAVELDQAGTPGFQKLNVRIHQGLPGPGWSGTSLSNAKIEVVPFLRLPAGGRLFDHNRHANDFDNYVMRSPDLAIWSDATACPAAAGPTRARLVFRADWSEQREGVLSPGGEMTIVYDNARLAQCRNWRNGNPLYDITAHVVFSPGNQQRAISVRDTAPTIAVPSDARGVTLWFENTAIPGCQAWDSNLGANYWFDAAVAPHWMGEARTLITRGADDPCAGGVASSTGFAFDTWARQRAAISNLCFEVYQPGVTEQDDPGRIWHQLDTQLHYRFVGQSSSPWQSTPVHLDRRVGNNARYAFNVRALDPLRSYHCPEVAPTVTATPDGGRAEIRIEYFMTVNGGQLRPAPGGAYAGTFVDYATDAWRSANCQ
ncbi:MAG: DUF6209 family protein [Kofleriaceae bacterium]